MKINATLRDLSILFIINIMGYGLALKLGFLERYSQWEQQFLPGPNDEGYLILGMAAVGLSCAVFAWRRWADLSREIARREQAQATLCESETRFRQLAENLQDVVHLSERDNILYINPAYEKLWGRSIQSLYEQPRSWLEAIHPEDRDRVKNAEGRYLLANQALAAAYGTSIEDLVGKTDADFSPNRSEVEFFLANDRETMASGQLRFIPDEPVTYANGQVRWHTTYKAPLLDDQGRYSQVLLVSTDITAQKQIQEQINFQARLLDAVGQAVIATDPAARIVYWNQAAARIYGWSVDEALGQNSIELLTPNLDQSQINEITTALMERGSWRGEQVAQRRDGSTFPVLATTTILSQAEQQIGWTLNICTDISERKQMEEALRASRAQYQSVVDHVKEVIFQTDATGLWTFLNPAWTEMTGYSVAESLGQNFLDFVHPDDRQRNQELFQPLIERQKEYCRHQIRYLVKEGFRPEDRADGFCWIEVHARLTLDPGGAIIGAAGTLRDVTELKRAEEELYRLNTELEARVERRTAELSEANQRLRASQARYQTLFEDSPISLWEEDFSAVKSYIEDLRATGVKDFKAYFEAHPQAVADCAKLVKVTDVNKATLVLNKAADKTELLENLEQIFGPESHTGFMIELIGIGQGKTEIDFETVNYTLAGEKHYVALKWSVAPGYEETLGKVMVSLIDISKRKQAEEELRRRNRELFLFNRIIAISASTLEPEAMLETVCRELVQAIDIPWVAALCLDKAKEAMVVVAEYSSREWPTLLHQAFPLKGNSFLPLLLAHQAPLFVADAPNDPRLSSIQALVRQQGIVSLLCLPLIVGGQVEGCLMLATTEPHQLSADKVSLSWNVADQVAGGLSRARMVMTNQRLATTIEQVTDGVVITDTEGQIQYVNAAFERITGYSQAEVLGQKPSLLKSGKHSLAIYAELWATITAGQTWQGRLINKKKDGAFYTCDTTITPIYNEYQEIINYVAVKRDVTATLQLEEQYRQAQKMESVGRLAGGVAHDFNNILTAIMGYTGLTLHALPADSPLRTNLQGVEASAERAANLTRQLLAFARKQVIEPKSVNLNELISGASKILRRLITEDIELIILPAADLGWIKADPGQLEQVLFNLSVNARDAMPQGGKLILETANVTLDQQEAGRHAGLTPGDYVVLSVTDTGIGMDEEVKAHIFEPFFTTKEPGKGTGLGLATCFGIVKQSGGHIWVESELNKGTTFRIYFPRLAEVTSSTPLTRRNMPLPNGVETILLVEDEPLARDTSARTLRELGYTVLEAENGEAALREIDKLGGEKLQLLITDLVMPQMGGKALVEKIKPAYPKLKVMLISGYTDDIISQHYMVESGAVFLQKPFSPATIARKVRELLDRRS